MVIQFSAPRANPAPLAPEPADLPPPAGNSPALSAGSTARAFSEVWCSGERFAFPDADAAALYAEQHVAVAS